MTSFKFIIIDWYSEFKNFLETPINIFQVFIQYDIQIVIQTPRFEIQTPPNPNVNVNVNHKSSINKNMNCL